MAGTQQQRKGPQVFNQSELADVDESIELGAVPDDPAANPTVESHPADGTAPPAPAEAPTATEPPPAQPERAIPYARFQEVVNERNQLREQWARLDERSKQIREAQEAAARQAQQQKAAAERPDPNIDPVGAELYDQRQWRQQAEQQMAQQAQYIAQMSQGYQQDQQTTQFNNWVVAEAQNYARQQPDYFDAAQHAANWRMNFWQGLGLPSDQARTLVMNESNLLAKISQQTGKPFAPLVYELAKSVGYQPRGTADGNGAAPTPAAVSQAGKVLSQVAKGQAMQGLSRAPSAGGEAKSRYRDMTPADIANMSEAEFSAALSNPQTKAEMEYAMSRADGMEGQDVSYKLRR